MERTTSRKLLPSFGSVLAAIITGAALVCVPSGGSMAPTSLAGTKAVASQPNVLLVLTDDQLAGTVTPTIMPNVYREMVQGGVDFRRGFVSNSCPGAARAGPASSAGSTAATTGSGPPEGPGA